MSAKLPSQLRRFGDKALLNQIEQSLESVEVELQKATENSDKIVQQAARHLVDAGGKRVRPVLTLITSLLGDGATKDVIDAAAVVELTHLATLYHDDVMDDAPTRRGVPTAQHVYGNSVAILVGDLLLARASRIGVALGIEAIELQARTFERLCIGQLNETIGAKAEDDPIEHYIQVLADKTGSLISASATLGAMLGNAPSEYLKPLGEFGEKVGVAFQLIDDVIDISEAGPSGKTPGTDLRAGVPTMPVLLLRKKTDEKSQQLLELIDGDLTSDEQLAKVVRLLREHEVAEEAYQEAIRWANEAITAIDCLPDGQTKRALIHFAEAVIKRDN
ncbi:MAG: polyprenyl synthetase family protein [Micrococcales bacterium]